MGAIFDSLSSTFGYILWFFFDAVSNYGLAITLFALVVNIIMFPLAIKRQKSMAGNARLAVKQQELKKKYEKNPKKYNEEVAKLYDSEGMNPMNGCFATLVVPLILWTGIFGAVTKPLQNTLHISSDKVSAAVTTFCENVGEENKGSRNYYELQIVRNFDKIKDKLTMFSEDELKNVEEYSNGFNFLGINLLKTPKETGFNEFLWVIPLLCFVTSAAAMYISQKMMGMQSAMEGCNKVLPYGMLLFTAYIAYTIPGAVGLYWVINSLFGAIQNIVLNKFYNVYTINAHDEAARASTLFEKESKITGNN